MSAICDSEGCFSNWIHLDTDREDLLKAFAENDTKLEMSTTDILVSKRDMLSEDILNTLQRSTSPFSSTSESPLESPTSSSTPSSSLSSPTSSPSANCHSDDVCQSMKLGRTKRSQFMKHPYLMNSQNKQLYTAELDVLCRICGDKASGYHYGVHSCEGCKGFFRRTLKKQLLYESCKLGKKCKLDMGTRNKCQYCRFQRCLNAGMSPGAVRYGRMPKSEREKLVADKEELSKNSCTRILELRSMSDVVVAAFKDVFGKSRFLDTEEEKISSGISEGVDITSSADFHDNRVFQFYQETVVPSMQAAVKFAKRIPQFTILPLNDQISLMKQGTLPVAVLVMHRFATEMSVILSGFERDLVIQRQCVHNSIELASLLDLVLKVCDRLKRLKLHIGEMALFSAILLITDIPGLEKESLVEHMQTDLLQALYLELKHNRPKNRIHFPTLIVLITDMRQIVEEFKYNMHKELFYYSDSDHVMPLLKEIFDLC